MKSHLILSCLSILYLQNVFGQNVISNNFNSQAINSFTNNNIGVSTVTSNAGANLANTQLGIIDNSARGVSNVPGYGNTVGASLVNSNSANLATNQISVEGVTSNALPNIINLESFLTRKEASVSNNIGNVAVGVGQNVAANVNSNLVVSNTNAQNVGLGVGVGNVGANSVQLGGSATNFGSVGVGGFAQASVAQPEELPVIGYVTFEGYLPVEGTVSVANSNNCGCST